jgi:TetR/AcrR family transcriptional regulator, transcriptional repressor for nem operon
MSMTKAEKTRQFIIEKSAPIFNIKGVAGTAMSDIMEATKLSKGSLYVHFESKEDLSYCAVDYNLTMLTDRILEAGRGHKSAKAKLIAIMEHFGNPLNPPVAGGCPMLNFGMEADDTDPVILQKVNRVMNAVQQNTIDLIEAGKKNGEFKGNWNSSEFATKSFALIEGGILISRISGNRDKMKLIISILKREIEDQSN